MYTSFFRLQREPFSIAPDPHFLFMSEAHREALAHLLYGLSGGGGFVLLTGEIGAGKTTVCRCFLDQVPADCDVAYVFNPKLSVVELLQTICDEFHVEVPAGTTIKDYVDPLNQFLLRSHASGRHCVLIIDEAQSLSSEVLEQLRLLTNLETAERKLLQIVLIGQPELRPMLARPELEQLAQRVMARYHLPALSERETADYIRHRLAVAGLSGEMPFDDRALRRIHQLCSGVPRRINLLAGRALLGGYASGHAQIDRRIVERAAQEVFDTPRTRNPRQGWAIAGLAALGIVLAGAAWNWPREPAAPATVPLAAASTPARTPAASAPAELPSAPALDAVAVLTGALPAEAAAWRELAPRWQLELGAEEDPCDSAAQRQVYCLRINTGLSQLRELGRPGLLTLHDEKDRRVYALLTGLGTDKARLSLGGASASVPLLVLAGLWRGEFATFWRAPPSYREPMTPERAGPLAQWVAARIPGSATTSLKARVSAFQVANGLRPDGLAGPLTLMQINRASGVDEPRLQSER
jgi:general secretion pathway protein A